MRISGESTKEVFRGTEYKLGTPFKVPSLELWALNVTHLENPKEKNRIVFSTKKDVDSYRSRNVNVFHCISADVISVDDGKIEKMFFGTIYDMEKIITAKSKEQIKESVAKASLAKELESKRITEKDIFPSPAMSKKPNASSDLPEEMFGSEEVDAEISAMLAEWEEFFNEKADSAKDKAQKFLVSMLDHYVDKELIESNTYIKAKTVIQSESLSMLFLQLDLTKQVLLKQFGSIMLGVATKPILDSFNQSQRMILDINTFINNIIKEVVADLQSFKNRQKEIEELAKSKEPETIDVTAGTVYRSKTQLLSDLEDIYNNRDKIEDAVEIEIETETK
jgi:hypothetical protein